MTAETFLDRAIVLVLNRAWQPIGQRTVRDAICALAAADERDPNTLAMDIAYGCDADGRLDLGSPIECVPVAWPEWIRLDVRECDLSIATARGRIRVPTVIVTTSFAGMPVWRPSVSRRAIYERDAGICQYTGRKVAFREGNVDHVVPRSRGGGYSFENLVWSDQAVNSRKADRLPSEAGLRLGREPFAPRPIPFAQRISVEIHRDWRWFMKDNK